ATRAARLDLSRFLYALALDSTTCRVEGGQGSAGLRRSEQPTDREGVGRAGTFGGPYHEQVSGCQGVCERPDSVSWGITADDGASRTAFGTWSCPRCNASTTKSTLHCPLSERPPRMTG